jgi:hypothetical protein
MFASRRTKMTQLKSKLIVEEIPDVQHHKMVVAFLTNMHLLEPKQRKQVVEILYQLIVPGYAPVEEEYYKKK